MRGFGIKGIRRVEREGTHGISFGRICGKWVI